MKFKTNNPAETRKLAKKLIQVFIQSEKNRKHALVISLEGELGSGKTTFTQGFAKALGIKTWIKSPTFILMREHKISQKPEDHKAYSPYGFAALIHIDCYRLKNEKTFIELGLKDILKDPKNIVFVEWGEKLKELLPQNAIKISLKHLGGNQREIKIL